MIGLLDSGRHAALLRCGDGVISDRCTPIGSELPVASPHAWPLATPRIPFWVDAQHNALPPHPASSHRCLLATGVHGTDWIGIAGLHPSTSSNQHIRCHCPTLTCLSAGSWVDAPRPRHATVSGETVTRATAAFTPFEASGPTLRRVLHDPATTVFSIAKEYRRPTPRWTTTTTTPQHHPFGRSLRQHGRTAGS